METADEVDAWIACTLCRSGRRSLDTLKRATVRKVEWPAERTDPPLLRDPSEYTTIDDAFISVLQYMSTTTRQCKRFYRGQDECCCNADDSYHCRRFHTEAAMSRPKGNPLRKEENLHIDVAPGTYAISAGQWGSKREQSHIVHLSPGQKVDLTFAF